MKIYFAASIRGGRDDAGFYAEMINLLKPYGTVLTEHFGDITIKSSTGTGNDVGLIYQQDLAWIKEADVIVAEVSTPSLGVGIEIGVASYSLKKPVLCLYRPQTGTRLSAMIAGCPNVTNTTYSKVEDLPNLFGLFFDKLKSKQLF